MRESDEPLTDTLVRCLADPTDLKALERLENDGDQAGARLMRARLADQAALRLDAALEDNRARVRRQLGRDWAWATDEVMSDLTIRTIRRLDCFASMFVRQVRQCFSAVWADGFPRCRHRFPVM